METWNNEEILVLDVKNDIAKIIEQYFLISKTEINKVMDSCVLTEDLVIDTYRLIIRWKDEYYNFKGKNIVFHPIKFVKMLLSITVSISDLNFVTIINILCDVLNVFAIKLSQDESEVLICIYELVNMMAVDDYNIYGCYIEFANRHNIMLLEEDVFFGILKKLVNNKLIVIENGNYFATDIIIGK